VCKKQHRFHLFLHFLKLAQQPNKTFKESKKKGVQDYVPLLSPLVLEPLKWKEDSTSRTDRTLSGNLDKNPLLSEWHELPPLGPQRSLTFNNGSLGLKQPEFISSIIGYNYWSGSCGSSLFLAKRKLTVLFCKKQRFIRIDLLLLIGLFY